MRRIIDRLRRTLPRAHFRPARPEPASSRACGSQYRLATGDWRRGSGRAVDAAPPGLATTRDDISAADLARVAGDHQAGHRLFEIRTVRADAGRRRNLAQAGQPGRLLAILRQHHLRGRGHVQARQRPLPQGLGVVAVVDAGLRRARADLQRARLPELPSEGRARPSAGRPGRCDLDVPAAGAGRRDRGREGGGRRPSGAELSRPGLWRAIAGPRRAGAARRRQDGDQLCRAAGDARATARWFRCASRATR